MSAPKAVTMVGAVIGALLFADAAWTQQGNGTSKPGTPQGVGQATTPGGGPAAFPKDPVRMVMLSGRVAMEDGEAPPERVAIQRVCGGSVTPEGYTDSKGFFTIRLGQGALVTADSSVGTTSPLGGFGATGGVPSGINTQDGVKDRDLHDCEIRASLPGYISEQVVLAGRRSGDKSDLGTILLHRGKAEGSTISVTTAGAPKDAVKAYDKAREAVKKAQWAEARKQLERAVEIYPQYAVAWCELGRDLEQLKEDAAARNAYQRAAAADVKFVLPHVQLAGMALRASDWKAVVDSTDRLLKLDAVNFPDMYIYNAFGNLNLKNPDLAEKSIREALNLDPQHRFPQGEQVLAAILADRGDYGAAAEHLRAYLQFAPNGVDTARVRRQLTEIDKLADAVVNAPK